MPYGVAGPIWDVDGAPALARGSEPESAVVSSSEAQSSVVRARWRAGARARRRPCRVSGDVGSSGSNFCSFVLPFVCRSFGRRRREIIIHAITYIYIYIISLFSNLCEHGRWPATMN